MGAASPQWKRQPLPAERKDQPQKGGKELHGLDVWYLRFEKLSFKASKVDDVQEFITYIGQS